MGLLDKILDKVQNKLAEKRDNIPGVNSKLSFNGYGVTQEYEIACKRLNELRTDAEPFKLSPDIMQHKNNNAVIHDVTEYVDCMETIRKNAENGINQAINAFGYTDIKNKKDLKEASAIMLNTCEAEIGHAKEEAEKTNVSFKERIANKLKNLTQSLSAKTAHGIDIGAVSAKYNGINSELDLKKAEKEMEDEARHKLSGKEQLLNLNNEQKNLNRSLTQSANLFGNYDKINPVMSLNHEAMKSVEIISKSRDLNKYLENVSMDKLADITSRIADINREMTKSSDMALEFVSDRLDKSSDIVMTKDQIDQAIDIANEREREMIDKAKNNLVMLLNGEGLEFQKKAIEAQFDAVKEFQNINRDQEVLKNYLMVEHGDHVVMFSETYEHDENHPHPAIIVMDEDNHSVYEYKTFAEYNNADFPLKMPDNDYDMAELVAFSRKMLEGMGNMSLLYQMQAATNLVYDQIVSKNYEFVNQLQQKYVRDEQMVKQHMESVYKRVDEKYKLSENIKLNEMAEQNFKKETGIFYDENLNYLQTPSNVMEKMNPIILDIRRSMEQRNDRGQDFTASKFRTTNVELMQDGINGKEYAPVYVYSLTKTAEHESVFPKHPTVNMVFDHNGDFQAAYYCEDYHHPSNEYLGQEIANRDKGLIDISLMVNNENCREFMDAYPIVRDMIQESCDLVKSIEKDGISQDVIEQAVNEAQEFERED